MNTNIRFHGSSVALLSAWFLLIGFALPARALTTVFFDSSQTTNRVAAGTTSDTIATEGYWFTCSRDKLFTGGVGLTNAIGRTIRIPWPAGLEAQAVTTGPNPGGARMVIRRDDGTPFALSSIHFKLLANTAGAGAALEIMPLLNGEDGVPDPYQYEASGYYGMNFAYATPELSGFDTYILTLYVDFALTGTVAVDDRIPPPILSIASLDASTVELSWPAEATGYNLESTPSLASLIWTPVTNEVVLAGDAFFTQVGTESAARYFRLKK